MIVTVSQRRTRAIDRLRGASDIVIERLRAFAATHDGHYVVFGSFARGDMVADSDFDVLVQFPGAIERQAREFAEGVCERMGLKPAVHLASEASETLLGRVRRDGIVLSRATLAGSMSKTMSPLRGSISPTPHFCWRSDVSAILRGLTFRQNV